MFRSALIASAVVMAAAAIAPAGAETPARCEETSFRVYFSQDAASLDSVTDEMLNAAARNVADCSYRELRVAIDPNSAFAHQRAQAIVAAADGRWDATQIEARSMTHRVSYRDGPDYAEVTMSPTPSANPAQPLPETDAGV